MFEDALFRTVNFDPYFRVERALLPRSIDLAKEGPRLLAAMIYSIKSHIELGEKSLNSLYADKVRITNEHCYRIGQKIEFLLQNGADPDALFQGRTAFQTLFVRLDPVASGRLEDQVLRKVVPTLVKYSKDFSVCDENGWSYLHYAVHRGLPDLAKELINKGLSVHQEDKQGITPYHLAFVNCSKAVFFALGIDSNAIDIGPKDVVKIWQKLPFVKSLDRYWQKGSPVGYYSMGRQFSTGFFDLQICSSDRLERETASLYHCHEEKSQMVWALENGDHERVKELTSKGWNACIENECATFKKSKPFYQVMKEICKDEKRRAFAGKIILALVAEPSSGISLASEFQAALYSWEEEKVYLLLDLGVTPEIIEQALGKRFNSFIWDWFGGHFDDDRGWHESAFYPAACRIVQRLIDRQYLKKSNFEGYMR